MIKKLRKRYLKANITAVLLAFAVFASCGYLVLDALAYLTKSYDDLSTIGEEDMEHSMIKGHVWAIIDTFASKETTYRFFNSKKTARYAIIPCGTDRYIAMYLPGRYVADADTLMQETWDNPDGVSRQTGRFLSIWGSITPLNTDEKELYDTYINYYAQENISSQFLPYILRVDHIGILSRPMFAGCSLAVLLALLWLIRFVIRLCTRYDLKTLRDYCKSQRDYNLALSQVEHLYEYGPSIGGIRINRNMILLDVPDFAILTGEHLIWAYRNVTNVKLYGVISAGQETSMIFRTKEGTSYIQKIPDDQTVADTFLKQLHEFYPKVILGYSKSLEQLYKTNLEGFINRAEQQAQHQQGGTT